MGCSLSLGSCGQSRRCPKRDRPRTSSGYPPPRSRLVRRAHIGKCCEQVVMGPDHVLRYLSICEERKEEIYDVVGERPAIVRVGRRPRGIVVEDVRQQGSRDPRCFRRRISTGMLQRVREDRDEAGIVRGLPSEIGAVLLAREERGLIWARTAVRLNPFPACAVERTCPYVHLLRTEVGVRYFQYNAAYVR